MGSYLSAQLAQQDVVYAIWGNNQRNTTVPIPDMLTILDPSDGSLTDIGPLLEEGTGNPITGIASLAVNSAGELFGIGQNYGTNPQPILVQINPTTAEVRIVGSYDIPDGLISVKGIAFTDTDQLIGIEWQAGGRDVYEFDITDGSASILFNDVLPPLWYGGAEYNPDDGLVYLSAWSQGFVYTLDPTDGTLNTVFSIDAYPGEYAGDIFIGADGEFYITTGRSGNGPNLWQVDLDGDPQTSTNITDPNGMVEGVRAATLTTIVIPREPVEPEDLPAMPNAAKWLLVLGLVSISSLLIYRSKFSL
ncbi:MAG: hypothetical protein Sapg2KO_44800 [Saprospiraceae bacterium]